MNAKKKIMNLVDMDVGLFVSYQLTSESLTTKLFRFITLNSIPLKKVHDFRIAEDHDVTKLNRINWFDFSRRKNCPVYTLQARDASPRIFMKLNFGTHIEVKNALEARNVG